MRRSSSFIYTLYEAPKEAEAASHIFLLRGSYISTVSSGLYSLLPLGFRVYKKIWRIIQEEMDGIGCQEVHMPVLNPAEFWKKTHRYYDIGDELFRIKDRRDREFVLAMTHEEIITDIAKQFLRSYRDLPTMLYHIQTKVRDEVRARGGLLRVREFTMKDAYSFHDNFECLDKFYPRIYNAYLRIFARTGLTAVPIQADPGMMGGTGSHEFMLESVNGEDQFVSCSHCDYRANTELAVGIKSKFNDLPEAPPAPEKVHTPGVTTIAKLEEFFGVSEDRFLKTVAYDVKGELVMVVLRGDYDVSISKLSKVLGTGDIEMAPEAMLADKGLTGGFLSPVGISGVRLVVDDSLDDRTMFVAGGNEVDMHIKNVVPGREFSIDDTVDIAEALDGDGCLQCREGTLHIHRGIELGHTFKLGDKYTAEDTMDVTVLDAEGKTKRVLMGCYGIGLERLMASVVEQWHDENGIIWPASVAPFDVLLTIIGQKPEVLEKAENIYQSLSTRFDVLYDDRDESAGVKFKDSDLLGIPVRVLVSPKLAAAGQLEIKVRKTGDVIKVDDSKLEETVSDIITGLMPVLDGLPYLPE